MVKIQKILILSLGILFLVSFKVGDEVELLSFLNARTSPNFLGKTKNIATTLSKGTSGSVVEIKEFPSGNSGLKMTVSSGPKSGQTYWVYYNVKKPALKIVKVEVLDQTPIRAAESIPAVALAVALEDIPSYRDPLEQALVENVVSPLEVLPILDAVLKPKEVECPQTLELIKENEDSELPPIMTLQEVVPEIITEDAYNETISLPPYRETQGVRNDNARCGTSPNGPYNICKLDGKVESIRISNRGPNSIVSTNEYYLGRDFEFNFQERARSDMHMMVSDSVDDKTSSVTYSIMVFLPRKLLPSIQTVDNELHVTLPNGELIKYNAKTKEIIGGVLNEGKTAINPNNKKAMPAKLDYTGSGVLIRADKSGDLPYGDIELRDGSAARSITTATVSKKGFKDCKIPSKDIWYTDNVKHNSLMKPEFASDEGLDQFIKKRCGFSIF